MTSMSAIGLMSGTSLDGVDIALINTDGESIGRFGPTGYQPYSDEERTILRRALAAAVHLTARDERSDLLLEAEDLVTRCHATAVQAFLASNGMATADIGIVGFHGQTVLHRPDRGVTVQLGNGRALARRLGIPVAYDFRAADVAAGGEGAPLVPVFHRALVGMIDRPHPVAVINLGGVANVTYIDGDTLVACDTGPGNALIDDFVRLRCGATCDFDGKAAAAGTVDEAALERILAHPYFAKAPPKSLDRNDFRAWVADHGGLAEKGLEDGAATLAAVTAASIARVLDVLPARPASWIVAGGGARNPTLMRMLSQRLRSNQVETADAVGWSVDSLEAQAFGYLAVRTLRGLPMTFPGTTGAPAPTAGGVVAKP